MKSKKLLHCTAESTTLVLLTKYVGVQRDGEIPHRQRLRQAALASVVVYGTVPTFAHTVQLSTASRMAVISYKR